MLSEPRPQIPSQPVKAGVRRPRRGTGLLPGWGLLRLVGAAGGVQEVVEPRERAGVVEGAGALLAMVAGALGGREVNVGLLARHRTDELRC